MEELVVFITKHWVLASLLSIALFAFIINEIIGGHFGSKQAVSAERAVQMMNHQAAVVFDFRTETEFSAGHIVGAERVTATTIDKKSSSLEKYLKKPIIIVTPHGQETAKIIALLQKKGFHSAFILSGGMQGWKSAGMPVIKS